MAHLTASGHETRDASIRLIAVTAFVLALTAALMCLVVFGTFRYLATHDVTRTTNPMAAADRQTPPAPRIQEHPAIELDQLRAEEDAVLNTYGWVDRKSGTVRIPIDRAMELQLQRGFAVRKESARKESARKESARKDQARQ